MNKNYITIEKFFLKKGGFGKIFAKKGGGFVKILWKRGGLTFFRGVRDIFESRGGFNKTGW